MLIRALFHLVPVSVFVLCVLAVVSRRQMRGELAVFFWYILVSGVLTALSYGLWLTQQNNLLVINLNSLLELVLLTCMYVMALEKPARWVVLVTGSAAFIFGVLNLGIQGMEQFNSHTKAVESVIIFIFTVFYFRKLLMLPDKKPLRTIPMFWINSGLLIYFAAGLFLFALGNSVINLPNAVSRFIWGMDMLIAVFAYAFIFIGIWKTRTTRPSTSS